MDTANMERKTVGNKSCHITVQHVRERIRLRTNERERRRMHDLNGALLRLSQVLPYDLRTADGSDPRVSKINTLVLARNYIVMQQRVITALRSLIDLAERQSMEQHVKVANMMLEQKEGDKGGMGEADENGK